MKNIVKILLPIGWVLILTILMHLQLLSVLPSVTIIYWWILLGWVYIVNVFHLNEIFSLLFSLALLVFTSFMMSLGLEIIGEEIARLSFILLLVGLVQALKNATNEI